MALIKNVLMTASLSLAVAGGFWGENVIAVLSDWLPRAQSEFVSRADSTCAPLWVGTARNDPALVCYLQTDTKRLCKAQEKQHLVATIERYRVSLAAYDAQLLSYLVTLNLRFGKTAKENDAPHAYVQASKEAARAVETDDLKKALKLETVRDEDLTEMLRLLALKGLIGPDDFGRRVPDFVTEAFVELVPAISTCPKPKLNS
jgi:hypothetical protein